MDSRDDRRVDGGNPADLSQSTESSITPSEELTAKRELKKILREDSNWSIRSISITALTGVSAAVIATQLNGLVSSFVLIALMAFVTASVSEIYRVFLALTGFGAKRAAARAAKVLPLVPSEQATPLRQVLEPEIRPITEALQVVTDAYRLSGEQESSHPGLLRRLSYRLRNYGKANPFLWLVVLFLGIALTTVSVAYIATDGEPPRIINRTVVQTETLPASDRAAIVAEAKSDALKELKAQKPTPTAAPSTSDPKLIAELQSMANRMATMETELTALKAAEAVPTPSPDTAVRSLTEQVKDLETERDALTKRVDELEAEMAKQADASDPATTGTTSAPVAG